VDEALPATAALAEHYHVSQATITRVLRVLAAEGLVRTVPGGGRSGHKGSASPAAASGARRR
jgi:DNA-binding GntR family transcriptional regulator